MCIRKSLYTQKNPNHEKLYILGESHSLPLANISIKIHNNFYPTDIRFIYGIKMYHLSNKTSLYSMFFKNHMDSIPYKSHIMLTIGEIDSRPNEGIWNNTFKKGLDYKENIVNLVTNYINFLSNILQIKKAKSITIQGIPFPQYRLEKEMNPGDSKKFLEMVSFLNETLREKVCEQKWFFLDVYTPTKNTAKWHLDEIHLHPKFYSTEVDKWIKAPQKKGSDFINLNNFQKVHLTKPSL